MNLRVGRIPFLVCAPFFHDFIGRERDFANVDFFDGPPRVHCAGLMDGSIHLSPASSIAFAQKPGAFVLSPTLCTSCSFEVRSVKLFSKFNIDELSGKRIRLTMQSRTSVALIRILLEDRFGVKPQYIDGTFEEGVDDACVLIGDQALEENEKGRFPFSFDLGSLWQDWQGLPFVFGAWIISREALGAELRPTLERYLDATQQSIENFRKDPSLALDKWLARYPVNLPRPLIEDYYRVLDYRFTDERKESLSLFLKLACKKGLVDSAPDLEFAF